MLKIFFESSYLFRFFSLQSDKSGDKSSLLKPFRLPTNHVLFTRLKTILISTVSQPNQVLWVPMMEQVSVKRINNYYYQCNLLIKLHVYVFDFDLYYLHGV